MKKVLAVSMMCVLAAALGGCATTSDLEKVQSQQMLTGAKADQAAQDAQAAKAAADAATLKAEAAAARAENALKMAEERAKLAEEKERDPHPGGAGLLEQPGQPGRVPGE